MPISSFASKSKSSVKQKSASPSSCHKDVDGENVEQKSASPSHLRKGVDCDIVSHDSNPDEKIVINENSSEHALAATLWPSKFIFPNKENKLDPNSPSLKLNSASASSSQSIAWGSKPSYYSIAH